MIEHTAEIKQAFEQRRRRQFVVAGVIVILWGSLVLVKKVDLECFGTAGFIAIYVAFAVAILMFVSWNWRCPACGRFLGRVRNPKFCPNCGVALQ